MRTWANGKLIEGKKQIDSFNFSLHYAGPCVWEGIRSYKQEDGRTLIFKLEPISNDTFITSVEVIPEPSTILLISTGLFMIRRNNIRKK